MRGGWLGLTNQPTNQLGVKNDMGSNYMKQVGLGRMPTLRTGMATQKQAPGGTGEAHSC